MVVAGVVFFFVLAFGGSAALAAEPKQVMLLHSFGRDFKPWSEYAKSIRQELDRQAPWPLDIIEHSVLSARSDSVDSDIPFTAYLRAIHGRRPVDLIVSIGAPAAAFVQQHRQQLFPQVPMVFTAVEQRRVRFSVLTPNDTVVPVAHDFPAAFDNILRVLPDTESVTVVNGASPLERFWLEEMRRELKPFENRIAIRWTSDQSFDRILKDAAELPPKSAIFWHLMIVDAAGFVHEGDRALTRLHAVAKAPIFSYDDSFFGQVLVGGPMHSVLEGGRQTAAVAIRVLAGEKAGEIKTAASGFATPKFDWREMQRWGISESRLPLGSEIHFRRPTVFEQYRIQILAVCAAIFLQTSLIGWLIYEHRHRQRAEVAARNSMAELTHLNRIATAGELSASIAHEVKQPLAAIVMSASAARRFLRAEQPDISKVRTALDQIESSGHHAGDIITSVGSMFRKETHNKTEVDINKLIWAVLGLVNFDLRKHQIDFRAELYDQLPTVLGDPVQLQQVILNLVMNAIDAMRSVEPRVLTVRSNVNGNGVVHVSIEDTGTGIAPSHIDEIFRPLFTTKEHGMGMGLSICDSIIRSHHGRIWASAATQGGSIFQFELPTKADKNGSRADRVRTT